MRERTPNDRPTSEPLSHSEGPLEEPLQEPRREGRHSEGRHPERAEAGEVEGQSREGQSRRRGPSAEPREEAESLLPVDEAEGLRRTWLELQARFVEEPRDSVADADRLVGQVIERIEERFDSERSRLEAAWASGEDVSTEELRIALQRYRDFFDRLLGM
jgi:hypothetical protein